MIIGVLLRNFKTYKNITFIPISSGDRFCGLIGQNGVGKSSILEALDFYFNNKEFKTNVNSQGAKDEECYVVPIFLIPKKTSPKNETLIPIIENYSNNAWDILSNEDAITSPTINNNYVDLIRTISKHIERLSYNKDTHYLLPIGRNRAKSISFGIFRDDVFFQNIGEIDPDDNLSTKIEKYQQAFSGALDYIKDSFQYVYIPKDIEPEKLIQFETKEIQTLLGTQLETIVSKFLTKANISKISQGLKQFVDDLSTKVPNYKFRAPSTNQPNLKTDRIYSLIIQDFFSLRELHKESDTGKDIALHELSSGEKQQAIITLIYSILSEYRDSNTETLIVAIDEPESSLHISACYEQFEKLYKLSDQCSQILFTSHWYGFIPAMIGGSITNITHDEAGHQSLILNIYKYREEIKLNARALGQEKVYHFPIDIQLKSSNDFVQSILMSVIKGNYNWLICEGSSDKVYLDKYLSTEIDTKKLRIIPVCTASEVKNIYNRLAILFDEIRDQLVGKVFLLIDTDRNPIEFDTSDGLEKHLLCRRLVNDENKKITSLVKIKANPKAPNTDIEDVLNGNVFNCTLLHFKNKGELLLDFVRDEEKDETSSYFSMDLRSSEKVKLDEFFNANKGDNKVIFANKYVELLNSNSHIPDWINEIKEFFNNNAIKS